MVNIIEILLRILIFNLLFFVLFINPSISSGKNDTLQEAIGLEKKARVLFKNEEYYDAMRTADRALQIRKELKGPNNKDIYNCLNLLGDIYAAMGSFGNAKRYYYDAFKYIVRENSYKNTDTAIILTKLAEVELFTGSYYRSLPLYSKALKILQKLRPIEKDSSDFLSMFEFFDPILQDLPQDSPLFNIKFPKEPFASEILETFATLYEKFGYPNHSKNLLIISKKVQEMR